MSSQLDITEAKTRWDELVIRARHGEEILLAEGGKPVVKLGPVESVMSGARVFGEFAGKIHISEHFSAPLSEDELKEWEK
jgi:antitoxin (DNA-binding transcriptional repressor) of toxin-antitoxin stability system